MVCHLASQHPQGCVACCSWAGGQPICGVSHHEADGFHQKKGMAIAGEKDERVRVAWRVTVAEVLEAQRLIFVDEMGLHTSLALCTAMLPEVTVCVFRCRTTVVATRRCFRA